jgi:hypothetical protein
LSIDKALVLHFNFRPWELDELTVSEVWFYGEVLQEKAKQQQGEQDHSLLPHFAEEAKLEQERQIQIALAEDKLTPHERLELARRLYSGIA